METIQGIGTIQIALFQIIGDIATIFWQFVATILAFSIAITKVYIAEKSYIAQESYKDNLWVWDNGLIILAYFNMQYFDGSKCMWWRLKRFWVSCE